MKVLSNFLILIINKQEIAKQFPTLPLSTILVAQQKFTEADINHDGVRKSFMLLLATNLKF